MSRTVVSGLVAAVVSVTPGLGAHAQQCSVVDRGAPTDGVTTVTVATPEARCSDPDFRGWRCLTLRSTANDNGVTYDVEVAYNRAGPVSVRGSFTWLLGGGGTIFTRERTTFARMAQDRLSREDQIRTIDLRFKGDGYQTSPRNGFPNISAVYADLLEYLVTQGIAKGVVGHYGSSGGGLLVANALAYHRADDLLDGVVFSGGPFWTDLQSVCTDDSSPFFGDLAKRRDVDRWNWEPDAFCEFQDPAPTPPYECRSLLGVLANQEYPNTDTSVIAGLSDDEWFRVSAQDWLARITAAVETFETVNSGHVVLETAEGANAVRQRIRDIVNRRSGPTQ